MLASGKALMMISMGRAVSRYATAALSERAMTVRARSKIEACIRLMTAALPLALPISTTHAEEQESQWGSGKALYDKVCGYCHAPEVGVGTVLAGRNLPEPYIRAIVRSGLNAMPAFPASYIDDASLAEVAEYLATLPAPAAEP